MIINEKLLQALKQRQEIRDQIASSTGTKPVAQRLSPRWGMHAHTTRVPAPGLPGVMERNAEAVHAEHQTQNGHTPGEGGKEPPRRAASQMDESSGVLLW